MCKLSVIVPIYNSEDTLRVCLDSIINSTFLDYELILIDDRSTDHSSLIIDEYKNIYNFIKVFKNITNKGQGYSRNIGIDNSQGEYITFVDSDDYISKTMYLNMFNKIEEYNYPDIVSTNILFVDGLDYYNKDLSFAYNDRCEYSSTKKVILDESPSVCNKLYKRSFINNYRFLENCDYEDVAFNTVLYTKTDKVLRMFNPDYFYNRDLSGVSGKNYNYNENIFQVFKILDEILYNFNEDYKDELLIICYGFIFRRIEEINYWDISKEERKEIKKEIYNELYYKLGPVDDNIRFKLSLQVGCKEMTEFEWFTNWKSDNRKLI